MVPRRHRDMLPRDCSLKGTHLFTGTVPRRVRLTGGPPASGTASPRPEHDSSVACLASSPRPGRGPFLSSQPLTNDNIMLEGHPATDCKIHQKN